MTDTAQTPETQTPTAEAPKKVKSQISIMVHVPAELKKLIDDKAKELNTSAAGWLRQLGANELHYTLTASTVRRNGRFAGMTKDQKNAAMKEDRNRNKMTLQAVMAAYQAGELDLKEIMAKYAKVEAAEAEAAANGDASEHDETETAPEGEAQIQPVS